MTDARRSGFAQRITTAIEAGSSWVKSKLGGRGTASHGRLLADDGYEPAPFGLSNIEEQRSFEVNERKVAFAMHDDVDERTSPARSSGKPFTPEEAEPR